MYRIKVKTGSGQWVNCVCITITIMGILCDVVLLLHRRNVRIIQLSTRAGNVRIVQFNEQVMYNVLDNS